MNTNGLITAPVAVVADIANVLGVASTDLGYLCSNQHNRTNKWSRFKPLIYKDVSYHLLNDYENGGTLWQGEDGSCGLSIPYTTAISNSVAAAKYFDGEMKWGYNAPEPNSLQPARALDFDGYYHYAEKPITAEVVPTDVWLEQAGSEKRFLIGFDVVTQGTKYNLGLDDIQVPRTDASGDNQYITNWYVGLLMKNSSGQIQAITSANPMGEGDVNIEFYVQGDWLPGTWTVMPFLSKDYTCSGVIGDEVASLYISLDIDPFDIEIHDAGTLVQGITWAYWVNNDTTLKQIGYQGTIANEDSSSHTYKVAVYIYLTADGNDPFTSKKYSNEGHKILGEVTVPAKSTVTFQSSDLGTDADYVFDPIQMGRYVEEYEDSTDVIYWAGVALPNAASVEGNLSIREWTNVDEIFSEEG